MATTKAFDPYKDINRILGLKQDYVAYDAAGETQKRDAVAQKAKAYYQNLSDNGYSDLADNLQKNGTVDTTKKIRDSYGKMYKTPAREYITDVLSNKYGLNKDTINQNIKWDDASGQVYLGGVNLGKPYSVIDGVSYFDRQDLDKGIENYVNANGVTIDAAKENKNQETNLYKQYEKLLDTAANENPYETAVGKSILERYDGKGWEAGYNAAASGAAENGGNLDSFAAANAMRQQAALRSQGEAAALDAHNQKIQNIQTILQNLGVEIGNQHSRTETAKINDTNALATESASTGYIPTEWEQKSNPYFTADGKSLINPTTDYKQIMDSARAIYESETASDAQKEQAWQTYRDANTARNFKIQTNPEYAQYAGTMESNPPQPNADIKLAKIAADSSKETAEIEADTNKYITDKNADASIAQIQAETAAQKELIQENAKYAGSESDDYAAYNTLLSMWPVNETEKRAFIEEHIKPLYESGTAIPPESLKQLILTNTQKYNIDVDDATKICQAYGVSTDWLNQYRDRTKDDGNVTWYDESTHEGQYGGMVHK